MKYIVLFAVALCGFVNNAWACQCLPPSIEKAKKSYDDADVVIDAKVTNLSGGWGSTSPMVKLQVNTVIKGNDIPKLITADYNENHAACGNDFTVGQTAIIALYDTRSLMVTDANARGYGFRVMISCHQEQVRYYVDRMDNQNETTSIELKEEK